MDDDTSDLLLKADAFMRRGRSYVASAPAVLQTPVADAALPIIENPATDDDIPVLTEKVAEGDAAYATAPPHMQQHLDALREELARWLEAQPGVARVYYPGLSSHPQHALAMRQQKSGGAIVSFDVEGGREAAWRVIDSTRLLSITANLGDTKTTITHPATTTHGRISPEARAAAGIGESLLRIAVGLESVEDLKADLARGLALSKNKATPECRS